MVAVSAHGALGVDVEATRPRPPSRALLRRALTTAERDFLVRLPPHRRHGEFLRAWTAKEAILKATREGLRGGLTRLELDLVTTPVRLRSWAGSAARAAAVRLVELDPGDGHTATLATIGAPAGSVTQGDGRSLVHQMTR
jgi:4'-phosphopantetheinyl transferase